MQKRFTIYLEKDESAIYYKTSLPRGAKSKEEKTKISFDEIKFEDCIKKSIEKGELRIYLVICKAMEEYIGAGVASVQGKDTIFYKRWEKFVQNNEMYKMKQRRDQIRCADNKKGSKQESEYVAFLGKQAKKKYTRRFYKGKKRLGL